MTETTDKTMNRRAFAAAAVGTVIAVPALAQPERRPPPPHDADDGPGRRPGMPPMGMLTRGDWVAQVKAQHAEIARHFDMIKATSDAHMPMRMQHFKMLATILTGHSIAEEVALYPGVAMKGDTAGSDRLYMEQQHAKVMVAELDAMPKSGPEFMPRLMKLEAAIKEHVAEEEGQYYPALMRGASPAMNEKMTMDFRREFTRYVA